jgi:hypothetical protein
VSSVAAPPLASPVRRAMDPGLNSSLLAVSKVFKPAVWVDLGFVVFLGAIVLWRWQVIRSVPEPSGIDAGNWLAYGHALLGSHSRSASLVYPPLVPALSVALATVWGPLTGVQLLAAGVVDAPFPSRPSSNSQSRSPSDRNNDSKSPLAMALACARF